MKKRLGICGCTGHVVKFGEMVNSFAESEIAVVWDYREERGRKVAETLNVPFEPDYEKVLDEYGLDGVLVITENSHKAELCIRAAEHGLSIFVEKPMCVSLKEAYAVRDAVNRNGVKFFMTDPFVRRGLIKIKEMMKNGELGTVTEAIFRICQNRPRYGTVLSGYITGRHHG
ncbi:MAG: Gfo/Idh/MocA family oxidoreductase [Erysipelotrichaceae bacterium]|nr:Gfo/Idh/MocA family oxidoreductase [Erysipelotrichaceae bacterium]MBQ2213726.1 Gfo/Idh/MocA family oxidoreductase [Erysipelotrichaceae bacterium]